MKATNKWPDAATVKRQATGQWCQILQHVCGLTDEQLNPNCHQPCPSCGGTDRFRAFDDVDEKGGLYCNQCHDEKNGDGFASIMWLKSCTFPQAVAFVADALGQLPEKSQDARRNGTGTKPARGKTIHPTLDRALQAVAWGMQQNDVLAEQRQPDDVWMYHNADGTEAGAVARWNLDGDRKTFRQITRVDTGWISGGMPSPRPLYNLPAVIAADSVWICEGEKAADAINSLDLVGTSPSQGSKSPKLSDWELLDGKRVVIVPDNDEEGEKFATAVHRLIQDQAPTATVEVKRLIDDWSEIPPKGDAHDWCEHHDADDAETLRDRLESLPGNEHTGEAIIEVNADVEPSEVELSLDETQVNDEVIAALCPRLPNLYQQGGRLTRLIRSDDGCLKINPISAATLREMISASVLLFIWAKKKDDEWVKRTQRVPKWCTEGVHARGQWNGIRQVAAVVTSPVLRPDGSVAQNPGYDHAANVFLDLAEKFPPVPESPSAEEVQTAVEMLMDLVVDFPFSKPAHKATWLAAVLTPLSRDAYKGPTSPLFLIDANVRGSGKSLLADLAAIITTRIEAPRFPNSRDDNEVRKRITAAVSDGVPLMLVDNISGKFGCASLDAALTAVIWSDRTLGLTSILTAHMRITWMATGNNVLLAADTSRRVAHIRLESPDEHPEEREGFKYPDVRRHTRTNRPDLIVAALTILRGYFAAGCPNQNLPPWGSFEGWSDTVRSAVVWAGMDDPGDTREELRDTADSEAAGLESLLSALGDIDRDGAGLTASQIIKAAKSGDDLSDLRESVQAICDADIDRVTAPKLGTRLAHFRNRVIGGRSIDRTTRRGANLWFVRTTSGANQSKSGGRGARGGRSTSIPTRGKNPQNSLRDTSEKRPPHQPRPPHDEHLDDWASCTFE